MTDAPSRCPWCGDDPAYIAYHDEQWGVPVHDDRTLFEMLTLEGAQAGLSWRTVLNKRSGYRAAGYPWLPGIYLLSSTVVVVGMLWSVLQGETRGNPLLGLAVLIVAGALHAAWRRRRPA